MSSNPCQFWLSNDTGKDTFQVPVVPESIKISCGSNNESVVVSGLGEVTIIQDPAAKVFEWTSHFPAVKHQGSISNPLKPQEYVDKIESWIASKKPVKFTVTDPKISLFCSIESWEYYEQGGDPGTFYYTIKLRQYIEPTVRKLDMTPTTPASTTTTPSTTTTTTTSTTMTGIVTGGSVYVRSGPSTSYKAYGTLHKNNKLTIYSTKNGWYEIAYAKGKNGRGWMSGKYVKVTSKTTYQSGKVKTNGSRLMLRKSASTSAAILAKMPNGSALQIKSKTGSWYAVIYNNIEGYASAQWVKVT